MSYGLERIYFSRKLLKSARAKYYRVYVDNPGKGWGSDYKGSLTAVKGVWIRVYPNKVSFDCDFSRKCFSNDDLVKLLAEV